MPWLIALLGCLLLTLALGMRRWGGARLEEAGLPVGEVVYSDMGGWEAVEQPLLSRRYGLVGKPDYLVKVRGEGVVPVEVKSRRKPEVVPAGHILQLATYCLLVEDVHKVRPTHGLLHYADATLRIDYTPALRQAVLDAADGIRRARTAPDLSRDHNDPARCRGCGYSHACGEES